MMMMRVFRPERKCDVKIFLLPHFRKYFLEIFYIIYEILDFFKTQNIQSSEEACYKLLPVRIIDIDRYVYHIS